MISGTLKHPLNLRYPQIGEHMTEQMPKDIVVKLRQVSSGLSNATKHPDWLLEQLRNNPTTPWTDLLNGAADELEQMQQLNGRLLRRLAGD
jgi:hypothetical protein